MFSVMDASYMQVFGFKTRYRSALYLSLPVSKPSLPAGFEAAHYLSLVMNWANLFQSRLASFKTTQVANWTLTYIHYVTPNFRFYRRRCGTYRTTCTILVDIQVKALFWTDVLHCKNFNNLMDKHTVLQEFSPGNIFASCLSREKNFVRNFVHLKIHLFVIFFQSVDIDKTKSGEKFHMALKGYTH